MVANALLVIGALASILFPQMARTIASPPAPRFAAQAGASRAAPDVLTEAEARARAAVVRDVSYELAVELEKGAGRYEGKARIRFSLVSAGADLRLDFRSDGPGRVTVNGRAVDSSRFDGAKIMIPAAMLRRGSNVVSVDYSSTFDHTGTGVHRFVDPADRCEYVWTQFEPFYAHRFAPCFDQPDLKGTLDLTVTAPAGWVVAANSAERGASRVGARVRHVFKQTPRISTYLWAMVAGDYAVMTDSRGRYRPRILARRSMKRHVESEEIFLTTRKGLEFLARFFSTPYPFEKYDQAFVPEFSSGAMENPGLVVFNEAFLFRRKPSITERQVRAGVILHEMAHMWFGDLVTMRWWDGLWLNESFATYMSLVALVGATPFDKAFDQFLSGGKAGAYHQDQLPTTHPVASRVPDTNGALVVFDGITYGKGAACLKQLAFVLGVDAFRKGLAIYFRRHAWGNADTADFFAAMGEACGRSFEAWYTSHLKTSGVNAVKVRFATRGGKITAFDVDQERGSGDARLREHHLRVATYGTGRQGELVRLKEATVRLEGGTVPVKALVTTPAPAFVWPNQGDEAYALVSLDPGSLAFALRSVDRIPDALTRRGVWLTLWEMVRRGSLAPRSYVEAFLGKSGAEPDVQIVEGLFGKAMTCVDRYLAGDRQALVGSVHELAWRVACGRPGSDAQRIWWWLVIDSAWRPDDLARLERVLDGAVVVPGLELDPDRRWRTIVQLCTFGRPGAAERIRKELERDSTSLGKRSALAAEACLPDPARKEATWRRILEDRSLSLDQLRALMAGFHRTGQAQLSARFVDRYFEAIPGLKASHGPDFARAFVAILYPGNVIELSLAKKAREFLGAHPELSYELRRPLMDAVFETELAVRLRSRP